MEDADDELLGARAVHTHRYCSRRFWLEEVARVRIENAHVVQGLETHRRVDVPGGRLPPPGGEHPDTSEEMGGVRPWHSRSLWLSSPSLGVSAKLDLVEVDGDAVIPVDTKKGRGPEDGLWPADAVQLALHALLLREAGYAVREIGAWYAEERRKVVVPLDEALCEEARVEVARARSTLTAAAPPAPLVDSPKCLGCSVHGVCLPDETRALASKEGHGAIVRVVPPNDEVVPLYVTEHTAKLGVDHGNLRVTFHRSERPPVSVPMHQLHSVTIVGNAQASTQALHACMDAGVMVHWLTGGGWHLGRMHGDGAALLHVRRAQFAEAEGPRGLEIARVLVADKIANVRTLLRRNDDVVDDTLLGLLKALAEKAASARDRTALLAIEAEAAHRSWKEYSRLVAAQDAGFAMAGRSRRPPRDRTNAMLGFAYGLLVKDCVQAVVGAGLDAFLGVYHVPHAGRPSLALDLMEPFRPLVADSAVLSVVRRREVEARGFIDTGQAVVMAPHTRRALISAYERRISEEVSHPLFGYRIGCSSHRDTRRLGADLGLRAMTFASTVTSA